MLQIRVGAALFAISAFLNPSDDAPDVTARLDGETEFRTFPKTDLTFDGRPLPTLAFDYLRETAIQPSFLPLSRLGRWFLVMRPEIALHPDFIDWQLRGGEYPKHLHARAAA